MNPRVSILTYCLGGAFWLALASAVFVERNSFPGLAAFAPLLGFAVAGEALVVHQRRSAQGAVLSFPAIAHVAAAILVGPVEAAAIAALGVVAVDGVRSPSHWRWVVLNSSMFGAAIWVGGSIFVLGGGSAGTISVDSLPAVLGLVASRYLVTALVLSLGTALSTGESFSVLLKETTHEELRSGVDEGSLGFLLAFGLSEQWIVLPFLLPLLAAIYSSKSDLRAPEGRDGRRPRLGRTGRRRAGSEHGRAHREGGGLCRPVRHRNRSPPARARSSRLCRPLSRSRQDHRGRRDALERGAA